MSYGVYLSKGGYSGPEYEDKSTPIRSGMERGKERTEESKEK